MIDLSFTDKMTHLKAIIYLSQAGMEGGKALANILSGRVTPSGKLTDTWGYSYEMWPSYSTFGADNGDVETEYYTEGIFVGYRWFDAFGKKVRYPFGYGLSYTDFRVQYENARIIDGRCKLEIRVTNIGKIYPGKEVVQVYAVFPEIKGISREEKKLIGFRKTKLLNPGESHKFSIEFSITEISRFDEEEHVQIVDRGLYGTAIGNQANDIKIVALIDAEKDGVVDKVEPALQRKKQLKELHHVPAPKQYDKQIPVLKIFSFTAVEEIGCRSCMDEVKNQSWADEIVRGLTAEQMISLVCGKTLRLSQHYQTDKNDQIYLQDIENAVEHGFFVSEQACREEIGTAVGEEMKEFGISLWLAPGMNIHRNPLCGRNFEYYSEDPLISGKMAAAITKGVQQNPGVGTTIKHFAANNQEDNRMGVDCVISERALREIYLKGFQIAVKGSQPKAIMTSYNKINGVYASNSKELCMQIARKEWGFKGIFMTDWTTTDNGSKSYLCIKAGNDLIMPGTIRDHENIGQALENGELSRTELTECVRRIVQTALKIVK